MSTPIAAELRKLPTIGTVKIDGKPHDTSEPFAYVTKADLDAIADRIDAEHRRRMEDCRREVRHATIRYLRGVLTDYDKGIKRVRKGDAVEVVRCADCRWSYEIDGHYACSWLVGHHHFVDADGYCDKGERTEDEEPPMSEGAKRIFDRLMRASGGDEVDE